MKMRDSIRSKVRPRRAWLLAIPAALLCVLFGLRKVQQLREPVEVVYGPKDIESRVLLQRMAKEAREHPWAHTIYVGWSAPWPKESGLNLSFNEGLDYNRSGGTLEYGISDEGWTYSHVESSGIELLSRAHLTKYPTHLSPSLDAQLRRLGWVPE